MLKSQPFIVIGGDPWSKKRVKYCIEGKGVKTFTVCSAQNDALFVDLL